MQEYILKPADTVPSFVKRKSRADIEISAALFVSYLFYASFAAANPFSRSARMSSMCSVPMERRIVFG